MSERPPIRYTKLTREEIAARLAAYEQRYGMTSDAFILRWNKGELGDDMDLMRWAGLLNIAVAAGVWDGAAAGNVRRS